MSNDAHDPLYAEALATFDRLFAEAAAAGEPDPTGSGPGPVEALVQGDAP